MRPVWLVGAALLAGCGTPGPTGNAILTGSIASSAARLVIYRPAPYGLGVEPDYIVDGRRVPGSKASSFVVCDLTPGRHSIVVENATFNVKLFAGRDRLALDLEPGSTTYLRAQLQAGLTIGILTLSPVSEEQGLADTAKLRKLPVTCGKHPTS